MGLRGQLFLDFLPTIAIVLFCAFQSVDARKGNTSSSTEEEDCSEVGNSTSSCNQSFDARSPPRVVAWMMLGGSACLIGRLFISLRHGRVLDKKGWRYIMKKNNPDLFWDRILKEGFIALTASVASIYVFNTWDDR